MSREGPSLFQLLPCDIPVILRWPQQEQTFDAFGSESSETLERDVQRLVVRNTFLDLEDCWAKCYKLKAETRLRQGMIRLQSESIIRTSGFLVDQSCLHSTVGLDSLLLEFNKWMSFVV